MLSLSIIVPATGRQEELDNTLVSVLENRPKDCEILVPHSDSYHDPYDLGDEVRFVPGSSEAVVDLYNAGIRASRADVIHLLGSGSEVSPGWADSPRVRLAQDAELVAVSPKLQRLPSTTPVVGVTYRRGGSRRVIAGRRSSSSTPPIDAPCLHAAFFRNRVLNALGLLDASLDEFYAEVDLAARMRRLQLKCEHDPDSNVKGILTRRSRGFQAARQMERVFWRHAGANGRLSSLVLHVAAVTGHLFPQIISPHGITSSFGHLFGTAECLMRGPGQLPAASATSAGEESLTIRLHIPRKHEAEMAEVSVNRRGA